MIFEGCMREFGVAFCGQRILIIQMQAVLNGLILIRIRRAEKSSITTLRWIKHDNHPDEWAKIWVCSDCCQRKRSSWWWSGICKFICEITDYHQIFNTKFGLSHKQMNGNESNWKVVMEKLVDSRWKYAILYGSLVKNKFLGLTFYR